MFWRGKILIGFLTGFIIGIIIKLAGRRKEITNIKSKKETEVVLVIECREEQAEMVKDILWDHFALGVSKLSLD